MKCVDQNKWDEGVRAQGSEEYGLEVYRFAARWADAMEAAMAAGETLENCAKRTSHEQAHGITGFMYGCAVSILSQLWEHGEQLRRWHNLDSQIRDEGECANAEGGVLNPAILVMNDSKQGEQNGDPQ